MMKKKWMKLLAPLTAMAMAGMALTGCSGGAEETTAAGGGDTSAASSSEEGEDAGEAVTGEKQVVKVGVMCPMSGTSARFGELYQASIDAAMKAIEECNDLAPLHNPANLIGIRACQELMPNTPMAAVFDTAFHQTMPQEAYLYGLPYEYYEKYKVRRYGFHGTSHSFVSKKAAEMAGKPYEDLKIIVCHLGNGASLSAVDHGKSVDTSMGLTPLEGLIMGTRSGDIDPAIMEYIAKKENLDIAGVMNVLNKKSGVLGISGVSSDFRDIENAANEGNERAATALRTFNYRVIKYIGAYAAAMNGVDIIAFTAGLGENDKNMRKAVCDHLSYLGVKIDEEANNVRGVDRIISTPDSAVQVMIVPTNEELAIARETLALV